MVLNNGWCSLEAEQVFEQISTNDKKVKTIECLEKGLYPVIDQGQGKIAGYINDIAKTISVDKPLVIFGDHTRAIKWVDYRFVPGADGTKILKAKAFVDPRFLYYQLSSIERPDKGYARHFKELKEANFLVPSFAEQQEIATRLDDLLAQVDAIKVRLDAIPAILKRFRQAVLAAAIQPKEHSDWQIKAFSSLVKEMRNGLSPQPNDQGKGYKILRISSVRSFLVDLTDYKYLECDGKIKELYQIKSQDLLFTRYNGSLEFVGVCGRYKEEKEIYLYPDKLIRVRVDISEILPEFVEIFFATPQTRKVVTDFVKSTSGQKGISGGDLKSVQIHYPAIKEQTEIVNRVEQLFAFADQIEQQVQAAQTRVNQLTQAILAKAFKGELTAAWRAAHPELISGEHSAEALLEKIKATQASIKPKRGSLKLAI